MERNEIVTQTVADPKPPGQSWKEYLGLVGELLDVLEVIADINDKRNKAFLDEYDMLTEAVRYLADHTSPCGVCMHKSTDKCTGAENSTCFELRYPQ